ncbi:hypothetical protein FNV43_RR16515 [Rhamnella rubrinervis]|uniref:OTU domain-containing protein n=1 Tax=Rhamnella rubrinervis TaxID=2594499 RepID=A0A8K0GYY8_9ROSA|nr:hypothetical protein FNV43_RR16515 [Rhamnella rubrinervis]
MGDLYTVKLQFPNNGCQKPIFRHKSNRSAKRLLHKTIRACTQTQDLRGQSVAVIGLGKSGQAAARLALARGASVVAIDRNENLSLLEQDPLFEMHSGDLRTILGHYDGNLLNSADRVIVSPGVPLDNYGLSSLWHSGKLVMSELDFAAEILPESIKILAVTGTNGKSTVVTFAGQMLRELGFEAYVGGNLGNPLSEAAFQCLASPSLKPKFQVAVVEVSSYQLEIPNKYFCPSVAVVLNLTPDHLERHGTMRNYAMTKCRLFSQMSNPKLGLLPFGNQHLDEAIAERMNEVNLAWIGASPGVKIDMEAKVASFEVPAVGIVSQLQLGTLKAMGTHNYHNAAVAALSVMGLNVGVDVEAIGSTVEKLRPPPHRMQILCKDVHGVTWVDDSKATNVEATYAGLMGLKRQKSVILLGGIAKVLDGQESNGFEQLVEPLNYHRCVITFGSSGTLIQTTLSNNGLSIPCIRVANLMDAVNYARRMAKPGDAVVLSPGCASFDEFRNFEHRGMVFQELARSQQNLVVLQLSKSLYVALCACFFILVELNQVKDRVLQVPFTGFFLCIDAFFFCTPGYAIMIVCPTISTCAKSVVYFSSNIQTQMGSKICTVISRGPSSSCCFRVYPGNSKTKYASLSVSKNRSSVIGQTSRRKFVSSCFSEERSSSWFLSLKRLVNSGWPQRRQFKISMTGQGMSMRLLVPKQGKLPKVNFNAGPISWSLRCASAGLICGLSICYSCSKPIYAKAASNEKDEEDDCDSSYIKFSHGKKVYTDYSIIGIPGDGRCLFRSVAHGACLRSGKPAPSGSLQRELADDLRAMVADEFIKRRKETEWFVEGDFDTYVSQIRKPHVWGGEPELFIASHVLQMPITVYMYDEDAGGLISIAEYGQEYGKENPIRLLYHGFGHYDALQIPGKSSGRSRL